jgi:hypothetical protein
MWQWTTISGAVFGGSADAVSASIPDHSCKRGAVEPIAAPEAVLGHVGGPTSEIAKR